MLKLTVFILIISLISVAFPYSTSHSSFQPVPDTCPDDVNRLGLISINSKGAFVLLSSDDATPVRHTNKRLMDRLLTSLPIMPRPTDTPTVSDHLPDLTPPQCSTSNNLHLKALYHHEAPMPFINTVHNALPIIPRSTDTPMRIDHSTPPRSTNLFHLKGTGFALACKDRLHVKGTRLFMPPLYHDRAPVPSIDTVNGTPMSSIAPTFYHDHLHQTQYTTDNDLFHLKGTHNRLPFYHNRAPMSFINAMNNTLPSLPSSPDAHMPRDHLVVPPSQCTTGNDRFHLKDMSQSIYKHGNMIGVMLMFLFGNHSPMSSFNLLLAITFHSFTNARSQYFNCTSVCGHYENGSIILDPCPNGCQGQYLKCNDTATDDCVVDCTGQLVCMDAVIHAGEEELFVNCHIDGCYGITINGGTGNMTIDCRGGYACAAATINGANQNTFINCSEIGSCLWIAINGTTVTGQMSLNCRGDFACQEATIYGGTGNMSVDCRGDSACQEATIYGGTGNMSVDCRGYDACLIATINGAKQSTFVICNALNADSAYACYNTTIDGATTGDMFVDCIGEISCAYFNVIGGIQNTYINCNGTRTCINATMDGGKGNTYLQCSGGLACEESTINGATVTGDMVVDCIGDWVCLDFNVTGGIQNTFINCNGTATCVNAIMDGGKGNTYLQCSGERACQASTINCLSAKDCNMTAQGLLSLADAHIEAEVGSKLFINASGSFALSTTEIVCPIDHMTGSEYTNDSICRIHAHGNRVLYDAIIYAVEAFYNVEIECNLDNNYSCYDIGTMDNNPLLYCTEDLDVSCYMKQSPNGGLFLEEDCLCADYLLPTTPPTINPTMMPTTSAPT
eukprot:732426_1